MKKIPLLTIVLWVMLAVVIISIKYFISTIAAVILFLVMTYYFVLQEVLEKYREWLIKNGYNIEKNYFVTSLFGWSLKNPKGLKGFVDSIWIYSSVCILSLAMVAVFIALSYFILNQFRLI